MPDQRIYRIICRTDNLHMRLFHKLPRRHIFLYQFFIAKLPHLILCFFTKMSLIPKIISKLQMTPMIQRISNCALKGFHPLAKFFFVRRISGDILFIYSIPAHLAPFIMICFKPYLRNIIIPLIFIDFFRTKMTVIIDDWKLFCIIMIQVPCSIRSQQKIIIHKFFHTLLLYC